MLYKPLTTTYNSDWAFIHVINTMIKIQEVYCILTVWCVLMPWLVVWT